MGDAREISSGFILERMEAEGIETTQIVRMPGLMTPVSAIMIDPSGERTLTIYRDPALSTVKLPDADALLADCRAVLVESRCATFATSLCAEARRHGIAVIVGVDRAMSLQDSLLTVASHLLFASEQVQETACIADDGAALKRLAALTPAFDSPPPAARAARSGLTRRGSWRGCRRSRFRPSIRSAPATCSMAPSRYVSPKAAACGRRCNSPRPPRR
ncbi:hypothetical protein ACVWW7_003155 [Bradyrhizobium sp. LM6.9]